VNPGALVLPALRWREDGDFAHEQPVIDAALEFGAGGFIVFGGTEASVRRLTDDLRAAAGRPLLIASDLERGAGQQVRGLAELPTPLALAALDDLAVVRGAGALTAAQALSVGINWVFAPVADLDLEPDNPIVQTRAFGADPEQVAALVAAWITGCEGVGALSCAKHWPGHGRTRTDSHDVLPVVEAAAELLRGTDFVPFRAAVDAGVSSIMTAHVAYPSLDPSRTPATLSEPILSLLRNELGFQGTIVSDALIMEGALGGRTEAEAACEAVRAGIDLLLYPTDPSAVARALDRAAGVDSALRARVDASLARYEFVLRQVPAGPAVPDGESGSAVAAADWLLSLPLLRGHAPRLRMPVELVVIDDDLGGRWPAVPSDHVAEVLRARGVPLGPGGSRIVLAFASPRASKGRAGFGPASLAALGEEAGRADLMVLFGHPRLVAELPGAAPVVLAWHRQRLMQAAVARWLSGRLA
jgi:beta-glucosidase-like glycosyl hydrolase